MAFKGNGKSGHVVFVGFYFWPAKVLTCPSSALDIGSRVVPKYGSGLFTVCRVFLSWCYIL